MPITTIKVQKETKERLDKLRESRSESYDDILRKILFVLNVNRDDPFKAKKILERISELRERLLAEDQHEESERKIAKNEKKQIKKVVKKKIVVKVPNSI